MARLPRALVAALRDLMDATTVDPNAAGMLYPVSPRSRAVQAAQDLYDNPRGLDHEQIWDMTGLTLSPDPENTGVWLGPRSWADARFTDEPYEPGYVAGDLDAFVTGAPLPQSMRDRIQIGFDETPGSQVDLSDDGHVITLGAGDGLKGLAHEGQHIVAYDRRGVPQGTNLDAARASRIAQDAFSEQVPEIAAVLKQTEDAYWANPTPQAKQLLDETRAAYDYALNNPDFIRDRATLSVYKRELGEALARWAEKNARRSAADIRGGKAPFADLDMPLAKTLVRGEGLWGKYRDRRRDDRVKRLADFFKIATALGGLGLSMGAVRAALEAELDREAA